MLSPLQWILVGLAAAAAGCAIFAVVQLIRSPYSPVQTVLYWIAWWLVKVWWRTQGPSQLPLAQGQGGVLVCNHRSSVDPFFIQVVADRKVHWMVAREYCKKGVVGWFLRKCEVIPLGRQGADITSIKTAMGYLSQGSWVGMFPEGRINRTDEFMLPARPGAVMIALKAGVPILPCYIEGSPYGGTVASPLFMRARVRVHFGEVMDVSEFYHREKESGVVEEITLRCLRAIAQLANRADFTPKLAGRKWAASLPSPTHLRSNE